MHAREACTGAALLVAVHRVKLAHHFLLSLLMSTMMMQANALWAGATARYGAALAQVQHAVQLAEQQQAQQTKVKSLEPC